MGEKSTGEWDSLGVERVHDGKVKPASPEFQLEEIPKEQRRGSGHRKRRSKKKKEKKSRDEIIRGRLCGGEERTIGRERRAVGTYLDGSGKGTGKISPEMLGCRGTFTSEHSEKIKRKKTKWGGIGLFPARENKVKNPKKERKRGKFT